MDGWMMVYLILFSETLSCIRDLEESGLGLFSRLCVTDSKERVLWDGNATHSTLI